MSDPELPSFDQAVADGPSSSSSSQVGGGFRSTFACISRLNMDTLHLVDFPRADVEGLAVRIASLWPRGVPPDGLQRLAGAWQIRMNGAPWCAGQTGPNDDGRKLLGSMLKWLYQQGWVLSASVALFQHTIYGDTMVFRHQLPPPPPCEWLVIGFDKGDMIKIMPHPPDDLRASLLRWLGAQVQKCSSERQCESDGYLQIKLNGQPWNAKSEDGVRTHMVLLKMLDALQTTGWTLYGSVAQQQMSIQDVLVVQRQLDWRPGQPVWQR